jgi:TolB-like protein
MNSMVKISLLVLVCFATLTSSWAQEQKKLRIAILDFTNTGGLSKQETVTLGNRLRSMLVKTNAFIVLERGQMDDILDEQGFQTTGCTTTECAVEMGKLLNVEKMISGTIGKLGQTYTIDLSLIDVKTAEIEKSFFRDFKGEIDGLLDMMQGIANQVATIVGALSEKKPILTAEEKIVTLEITSDPEGATIFINDRQAGKTPFKSNAKEGLSVNIRLEKANYKPWTKTIQITEDEEVEAELEYTETYKKVIAAAEAKDGGSSLWWWVGGGALVVGGAAVLIMGGSGGDDPGATEDQGFPMPPARPSN